MTGAERTTITLELDRWAHDALAQEARERKITTEQLAAYAVAYFLAERDSGRLARRVLPRPSAAESLPGIGG